LDFQMQFNYLFRRTLHIYCCILKVEYEVSSHNKGTRNIVNVTLVISSGPVWYEMVVFLNARNQNYCLKPVTYFIKSECLGDTEIVELLLLYHY